MTKNIIFTFLILSFSVYVSYGLVNPLKKHAITEYKRLLDERRGYLDDIPERNVDDDGGFIADDSINDDGQGE